MLSFKGRHFPKDIILMAVRWYVAYPLSYRNIEELMAERNVKLDHSIVQKWVVHYSPQLEAEFRKRKKATGGSWRMDETYGAPILWKLLEVITEAILRAVTNCGLVY